MRYICVEREESFDQTPGIYEDTRKHFDWLSEFVEEDDHVDEDADERETVKEFKCLPANSQLRLHEDRLNLIIASLLCFLLILVAADLNTL